MGQKIWTTLHSLMHLSDKTFHGKLIIFARRDPKLELLKPVFCLFLSFFQVFRYFLFSQNHFNPSTKRQWKENEGSRKKIKRIVKLLINLWLKNRCSWCFGKILEKYLGKSLFLITHIVCGLRGCILNPLKHLRWRFFAKKKKNMHKSFKTKSLKLWLWNKVKLVYCCVVFIYFIKTLASWSPSWQMELLLLYCACFVGRVAQIQLR